MGLKDQWIWKTGLMNLTEVQDISLETMDIMLVRHDWIDTEK
jgi:hypothetical protein